MDILKNFFEESTMVTIIVLLWLSAYFLITLWIYIYKSFVLSEWLTSEKYQLDMLLTQSISVSKNAFINTLLEKRNGEISKEILQVWKFKAT